VYAYNLFTQIYHGNNAPNAGCSSFAYGLMLEDSGNLAIVDSSGNSVNGVDSWGHMGLLFDTGTSQNLCVPGQYSLSGTSPCTKCLSGHFSSAVGSTSCYFCSLGN
jgi:hypothetical protein